MKRHSLIVKKGRGKRKAVVCLDMPYQDATARLKSLGYEILDSMFDNNGQEVSPEYARAMELSAEDGLNFLDMDCIGLKEDNLLSFLNASHEDPVEPLREATGWATGWKWSSEWTGSRSTIQTSDPGSRAASELGPWPTQVFGTRRSRTWRSWTPTRRPRRW